MKRFIRIATPMICLIGVVSCSAKNEKKEVTKLETEVEKYSYMVGQDMGKSLKDLNTEFDLNTLMKGVEDILKDNKSLLSDTERESLQVAFSKKLRSEHETQMSELGEKNTKEGKEFLEKNKKEKGVKTTESGLQYKVLKKGDGPKPTAEDVVTVHYKGTLLDGTEFDSSYKRGEPATFPVKGVIPGWTEALQIMNVGSKYKLFIPSELAYGAQGAGPQIAPNSVLVFEVELISIKDEQKKEAPKANQ